ncbi:Membrane protease YdiL, CAAX protease family [Loktanella sp. DSM 29012]|uniref:CPBP family intramembrane glutamic endopeptidase n=1 Tax=Loktanella sp. DSM 29012 TaxID=1881056 RepID=UPI0008B0C02F|nr:type II CAAX endopeptidase family protein [Loktanella sp. DSM 29012]SEQ21742.1 Membrane protease YdiL, CAAX protease family [Loktanella sp. DSM 29012]
MRPFSTFADKRPLTAAIVGTLFLTVLFAWPLIVFGAVDVTDGTGEITYTPDLTTSLFQAISALIVVLVVALFGWTRATGLIAAPDWAGVRLWLWIMIVPASLYVTLVAAVIVYPLPDQVGTTILAAILFALFIGLSEELMFRGLLMHGLRHRLSPGWALIVCSVLFGFYHGANALYGQDVIQTVLQIVFATAFGALLGAVTLQAVNLWPAIILHALWNLNVFTAGMIDSDAIDGTAVAEAGEPTAQNANAALPLVAGVSVQFVVFSILAWVIYRRWLRRMALDSAAQQA